MTTATIVEAPVETEGRELVMTDRCDRCGAQAYFLTVINGSELLFCAHHGREHTPLIVDKGFDVFDHSHLLDSPN